MKAFHIFRYSIAVLVTGWASYTFFRGSLTGAPPMYSHGWFQRILHFAAGIIFAAAALFACGKLYPLLSTRTGARMPDGVATADTQRTFGGYPPSVYMRPFQACSSPDQPCRRTDEFRVDPLPKGCCTLLVTNGDGRGNDEVQTYEVFLNGKRVLPSNTSRSAATVNLQTSNKIEVVLNGESTSKVFVLIAYELRQSE